MVRLNHYDDGKQKSGSHEVYSQDLLDHFNVWLRGIGDTREEAFNDFVEKLDMYIKEVLDFRKKIRTNNFEFIQVNCFGGPV